MLKKIVASLLLSGFSILAVAQSTGTPENSAAPTSEEHAQNLQMQKKKEAFCLYDDKRYSEGALKEVGKFTLLCKSQSPLSTSFGNRPAGWEPISTRQLELRLDPGQKK